MVKRNRKGVEEGMIDVCSCRGKRVFETVCEKCWKKELVKDSEEVDVE